MGKNIEAGYQLWLQSGGGGALCIGVLIWMNMVMVIRISSDRLIKFWIFKAWKQSNLNLTQTLK
jgi:hypothetical protein